MSLVRTTGLVLLLTVSLPISITAQSNRQQEAPRTTIDSARVNVVNVDVFVTDDKGSPVTDLGPEDFELFENGESMRLTNFARVDRRGPVPRSTTAPVTSAAALTRADVTAPPPAETPVWIALFVDNLNLRPFDRTRILGQLETFLTTELGPADRVMLASQEDGVQIREPFTADHARIAAALAELSGVRAEGNRYDGERRSLLRQIDQAHSAAEAFDRVRPYAERVLHDAERSMGAIAELADRLAGLPGQKVILHVSSGIPMLAAADLFWAIENRFRDMYAYYHMRTYGLWAQYEQLGGEVNGYDVSLYTLDASGLRAQGDITLEVENLSTPLVGLTLGRDRQENLQASLRYLADRTGGETILSVEDVSGPLARIAANLHTYYSLGYSPDHYGDGELYTIDVRVRHDGARVRHRDSYRDKSTATQMADGIRAALVHGVVDNPLGARLEIGDVRPQGPDQLTVQIRISIPAANLLALPDGNHGNHSNVSVFLGAIDAGARLGQVIELPSDVPAAVADGVTWHVAHELTIPTAARALAICVLDALSMESAFAVAQLPQRPE